MTVVDHDAVSRSGRDDDKRMEGVWHYQRWPDGSALMTDSSGHVVLLIEPIEQYTVPPQTLSWDD